MTGEQFYCLDRHDRMRELVRSLESEAAEGAFISDEAMTAWFLSLGTPDELPEPEAERP